jgi:hypothetical protein
MAAEPTTYSHNGREPVQKRVGGYVIFQLCSSHGLAEQETVRRITTSRDIPYHTGPLSLMVIGCVSVRRFLIAPLIVTEPPAEVMPLLSVTL